MSPDGLPERLRALDVSIGDHAHAGQLLKTSTYEFRYLASPDSPGLCANEFLCLSAAQRAGIEVPGFALSDDGSDAGAGPL